MANWQMVSGSTQRTDWSRNGSCAMQLIGNSRIQQIDIPVQPDSEYRLWMRAANVKGGAGHPSNVRYRMWVNDSLVYEETNGSIDPSWRGKSADFNTGSWETISVSFSCYRTGVQGYLIDDVALVEHDANMPVMINAEIFDSEALVPGIDNEDYVLIAFSELMNKVKLHYHTGGGPAINNLDNVLPLNNGHSWLNYAGAAGATEWNARGDSLRIYFTRGHPWASIVPGDTISANGMTICDEWGNPLAGSVAVTGSFGGEYGCIAGTVSPNNYAPIPDSSGTIITILETGQADTTGFRLGDFLLENVLADTYEMSAARYPFFPETLQVTVEAGGTTMVEISLDAFCIEPPFSTDFEDNGAGCCASFTGTNIGGQPWEWQVGDPAHSGVMEWGHEVGGEMCLSCLYVPPIDLSLTSSAELSFYHRYSRYPMGTFTREVQVSRDGAVWNTEASYSAMSNDWHAASVDLAAYEGDTVFVRYAYEANITMFDAWHVDDLRISAGGDRWPFTVKEQNGQIFLWQNRPNPVGGGVTKISYAIPQSTQVDLRLY
ncbi:MAG: hypothetical protein KAY24_17780, partial [Candidatus Eisenbacteria sp.]|nr:hypothetical protein [Candidatus Eisenbacteria bacterium]